MANSLDHRPTCPVPARRLERTVERLVEHFAPHIPVPDGADAEAQEGAIRQQVANILLVEFNPVLPTVVI